MPSPVVSDPSLNGSILTASNMMRPNAFILSGMTQLTRKIVVVDPQTAGISGDMLLGALVNAGADLAKIQQVLGSIPRHYPKCKTLELRVVDVNRHGFAASSAEFEIVEEREETPAQDFLGAAEEIAKVSQISERAASFATTSIEQLVAVESRLHGAGREGTHLHEAGSADTLADVFGVAAAADSLGLFDAEIYSTPVSVGGGMITFSHGTMNAPGPAVMEIARQRGIPIQGGPANVELATPTGMAMLANLTSNFVQNYPPLVPEVVGQGAGKKELTEAPNLLRVVIGHRIEIDLKSDAVMILETNLDDIPGEVLGHALQQILESGAKDAWLTPAQFKKSRPGYVLHVICDSNDAERLTNLIMEETGTLGVRYQLWNRFILQREVQTLRVKVEGREYNVRVKFARNKSGRIVNVKPEYDDVNAIAKDLSMPIRKVSDVVLREAQKTIG
jgi:uncharacterized protein (TIGR00299 family) protein